MKLSLKAMITGALVCTSLASASAATITTPAGSFSTPKNVNATSLSQSQALALLKSTKAKNVEDAKVLNSLQLIGPKFDLYQLQGKDKGTSKTALLAVYNAKDDIEAGLTKSASKVVGLDKVQGLGQYAPLLSDFGASIISQQFHDKDGGIVVPDAMMTGLIKSGNQALSSSEYMLNQSFARKKAQNPNASDIKVKFENMELIHSVAKTKYPTYTAGTRALITVDGLQLPYYVKAFVVMNPQAPTAMALLTSDVEGSYFQPMVDKAIAKLK